jgi:hypothetical protein
MPTANIGSVAVNEHRSQEDWTQGNCDDGEDEHDGTEPDEEGEPSLGALEGHRDQDRSWSADTYYPDLELDGAESGIGDEDGLDEQVSFRDWQGVGMV